MVDNLGAKAASIQMEKARIQEAQLLKAASNYAIAQESLAEDFQQWSETLNPVAIAVRRFDTLEVRQRRRTSESEKTEKSENEDELIAEIEKISEMSQEYERKNPELHAKNLLALKEKIKKEDSSEEILHKVLDSYKDPSLADEALDFLRDCSDGDLLHKLEKTQSKLQENYGREIRAGRNMGAQAREFSEKGLGSATGLRDLYRDIIANPREASVLFEELSSRFPFEKMKIVISFLFHSLGADLRSKGPSISRGELHRLTSDSRSLQAILGVYAFFKSRMPLIQSAFERNDLTPPTRITFELLAKLFVKFLLERYPSADKVYQLAITMGLSDELIAELIIFTQMRDAVRQVAPRLFKRKQHKQEILKSFIEALEDLEEKLEDDEEETEEEEE